MADRKNLEVRIRELAAAGEITYLSIVPVAGKGGIIYSASYSSATLFGHDFGRDADPVEAMHKALDAKGPTSLLKKAYGKGGPPKSAGEPIAAPVEEDEPWLK